MTEQLWGGETTKAVDNFPVSGEPVPAPVIRWLGRIKAAAARANARARPARRRRSPSGSPRPATRSAPGEHDDQFPVDVFQTGSGTSSNMNANEVIANLAGDEAHPNDHVNMGQSSNDVFPSAVHLAALDEVSSRPAAGDGRPRRRRWSAKATEFADVVKAGRTHLMDAVPVTLGQEFGGYAAQVRLGIERVARHAGAGRPDPARRHRHRHRAQHPSRVRRRRPRAAARRGHRARDLRARSTASRRRPTATPWSSCPARSRSTPSR